MFMHISAPLCRCEAKLIKMIYITQYDTTKCEKTVEIIETAVEEIFANNLCRRNLVCAIDYN